METGKDIRPKIRSGGSQNPIVFNDYESFIAKFADRPKTTDECWTPRDVYEAVVKYVGEVYALNIKKGNGQSWRRNLRL